MGFAALLLAVALGAAADEPRAHLIEVVTDELGSPADVEDEDSKGGADNNKLSLVEAPMRAGKRAFQHCVTRDGERAELAMSRTEIGQTYWYGWSLYLPEEYGSEGGIFAKWAAWPDEETTEFPCQGVGHKLELEDGGLEYHVQGSNHDDGNGGGFCKEFLLVRYDAAIKGKWIDFVQHVKWTGDADGFVKLWMKIGDAEYKQVVEYEGRTWWNDEEDGPYFKMGLYMGEPGWAGRSPAVVYTDEYRLGAAEAVFTDVAPGRADDVALP
jgi:hypothetical protein